MKRNRLLKSAALIFLAATLMFPLYGCMPGGKELAMAFVEEWMDDNNINPTTPTGIFNIGRRLASGSTGDTNADAALETVQMVQNFVAAEKLMDAGRKNRDPLAMDDAIKMRPKDWTYHVSRMTVALEKGDVPTAKAQYGLAGNLVSAEYSKTSLKYYNQGINELETLRSGGKWASNEARAYTYLRLADLYGARAVATGSQQDRDKSNALLEQYNIYNAK
jgi:hypothetical protein